MKILFIVIIIAALLYLSVYLEKQISKKDNILSKLRKNYELNNLIEISEIENIIKKSLPLNHKYASHELVPVQMLKAEYKFKCLIKYRRGVLNENAYQNALNNYNISFQSYQIANGAYQRGFEAAMSRGEGMKYMALNKAPSAPSKPAEKDYVSYYNKVDEMTFIEAVETEYSALKIVPNHNLYQISGKSLSDISILENEIEFIGSRYYKSIIKDKIARLKHHQNSADIKINQNAYQEACKKAISAATKKAENQLQSLWYTDLSVSAQVSDCNVSEFASVVIITTVKKNSKDGVDKKLFSDINAPGLFFYETNYTLIALVGILLIAFLLTIIFVEPKNNSISSVDSRPSVEVASSSAAEATEKNITESQKLDQSAMQLIDEAELAYAQENSNRSLNILRRAKEVGSSNAEIIKRINNLEQLINEKIQAEEIEKQINLGLDKEEEERKIRLLENSKIEYQKYLDSLKEIRWDRKIPRGYPIPSSHITRAGSYIDGPWVEDANAKWYEDKLQTELVELQSRLQDGYITEDEINWKLEMMMASFPDLNWENR